MLNVAIHAIMLKIKSHVYIYVTYDGPMNTLNMGLTKLVYHTIIVQCGPKGPTQCAL